MKKQTQILGALVVSSSLLLTAIPSPAFAAENATKNDSSGTNDSSGSENFSAEIGGVIGSVLALFMLSVIFGNGAY